MSDQIRKLKEKLDNVKEISNDELFEYCMQLLDLDFYNSFYYIKNTLYKLYKDYSYYNYIIQLIDAVESKKFKKIVETINKLQMLSKLIEPL